MFKILNMESYCINYKGLSKFELQSLCINSGGLLVVLFSIIFHFKWIINGRI